MQDGKKTENGVTGVNIQMNYYSELSDDTGKNTLYGTLKFKFNNSTDQKLRYIPKAGQSFRICLLYKPLNDSVRANEKWESVMFDMPSWEKTTNWIIRWRKA